MVTSSSAAVGCTAIVRSKSALVGAHLHSYPQSLGKFSSRMPHDVKPYNHIRSMIDNYLHQTSCPFAPEKRVFSWV